MLTDLEITLLEELKKANRQIEIMKKHAENNMDLHSWMVMEEELDDNRVGLSKFTREEAIKLAESKMVKFN